MQIWINDTRKILISDASPETSSTMLPAMHAARDAVICVCNLFFYNNTPLKRKSSQRKK